MHEMFLPQDVGTVGGMEDFARHYGCKSEYQVKKHRYRITTENPANFFWLGANMVNGYINDLNKRIAELSKQIRQ